MIAGAAFLLLALSGAAAAAPVVGGTDGGAATPAVTPAVAQASASFAGYYVTPAHAFASASATFVVPKVTCGTTVTEQFFGLSDTAPTGTGGGTTASVVVDCEGPTPTYDYDAFIDGEGTLEPGIKAGDTVEVSLYQSASVEEPKVFDITQNHYWDAYTAPIGDTAVGLGTYASVPQAKFSKVSFSQVQVNGQYLSFEPNVQYDLLDGAKTLATASAVPANGDSFNVKFKAVG